jgi:hypothetical protein
MDMPITKETFVSIEDPRIQNEVLFDIQAGNRRILCETKIGIEEIQKILSKRKHVDKAFSLAGGFIGGMTAIAGKWFFFK